MHLIKLYIQFVFIYFKSLIEYRAYFLIDIFLQTTIFGSSMALIWVLANRFQTVGGWNVYELLLLYNLNMFSYGVAGFIFWAPMQQLDSSIRQGTFDSMLIYPINPLIHLCFRNIAIQNVGNFILGAVVFTICFQKLQIVWSIAKIIWFMIVILSGSLIQLCLMIMVGASAFWLQRSNGVTNITFMCIKNFLDYPLKIYDVGIQFFLTFVVPYSFVNYYPAQYFLDRSGDYLFHPLLQFAAPFVSIAFLVITLQVWKIGLCRYESAGS